MFKRLIPYQGPASFHFRDPDTGYIFRARDRQALITRIISYRAQNGLDPIEALPQVLENYWCSLPENRGRCEPVKKFMRGWLQYVRGGVALLMNVLYKEFVTQDEADTRAVICVRCPYNVFPKKSGFDVWADSVAEQMVGDRKSIHHKLLGNCEVCSCPLRAKVFYKGKIDLTEEEQKKMQRVNCWQVKNI